MNVYLLAELLPATLGLEFGVQQRSHYGGKVKGAF